MHFTGYDFKHNTMVLLMTLPVLYSLVTRAATLTVTTATADTESTMEAFSESLEPSSLVHEESSWTHIEPSSSLPEASEMSSLLSPLPPVDAPSSSFSFPTPPLPSSVDPGMTEVLSSAPPESSESLWMTSADAATTFSLLPDGTPASTLDDVPSLTWNSVSISSSLVITTTPPPPTTPTPTTTTPRGPTTTTLGYLGARCGRGNFLPMGQNAIVQLVKFGVATFTCREGFEPHPSDPGASRIECPRDNGWVPKQPLRCVPITTEPPPLEGIADWVPVVVALVVVLLAMAMLCLAVVLIAVCRKRFVRSGESSFRRLYAPPSAASSQDSAPPVKKKQPASHWPWRRIKPRTPGHLGPDGVAWTRSPEHVLQPVIRRM